MTPHAADISAIYAHCAMRAQRQRATWMDMARDAKQRGLPEVAANFVVHARDMSRDVRNYLGFIRRMAT
jgi:hypothetical protein